MELLGDGGGGGPCHFPLCFFFLTLNCPSDLTQTSPSGQSSKPIFQIPLIFILYHTDKVIRIVYISVKCRLLSISQQILGTCWYTRISPSELPC